MAARRTRNRPPITLRVTPSADQRAKVVRSWTGVSDTTRVSARRRFWMSPRAAERYPTTVDGFQGWSLASHRPKSSSTLRRGAARLAALRRPYSSASWRR